MLQTTSIIRQRGQLTIPESIRKAVDWINSGSVVTVMQARPDVIVITPHVKGASSVNWDKLWRDIELSRSHVGKYRGSLSEFIAEDRQTRR